jgi:hypothetical protein
MLLTDLAMILFMVTAGAVTQAGERRRTAPPAPEATPLAIYRDEPGAPPFDDWLAAQTADPRQRLTIVARYQSGGGDAALQRAAALLREAEAAGAHPRIVIEPGSGATTTAGLAFDNPDNDVARGLRDAVPARTPPKAQP